MGKKRKNKKKFKKLLAQKLQQNQKKQVYQIPVPQIQEQPQNLAPAKTINQTPANESAGTEEIINSKEQLHQTILISELKKILVIFIIIAALFCGIYYLNQKTTLFSGFSQKIFDLFNKS